jgi:hypothetical protein
MGSYDLRMDPVETSIDPDHSTSIGDPLKTRTTQLLAAATMTGILLAGTACGAPQAAPQPTATTQVATPEPSPTATATVPAPAATETPAPAPVPEAPSAPAPETFTFPDGHISFTHPAGWTVKVEPGPALNAEAQKTSFEAIISDVSGTELARVISGMYGDGAAGPVKRTVLDHTPLPAINDVRGGGTEFGFAYDNYPLDPGSAPFYFMDVRRAPEFLTALDSSGSRQVRLPNGTMEAWVDLGSPTTKSAFASPDAAKAWMATEQYAQLKAMLLSLKYS